MRATSSLQPERDRCAITTTRPRLRWSAIAAALLSMVSLAAADDAGPPPPTATTPPAAPVIPPAPPDDSNAPATQPTMLTPSQGSTTAPTHSVKAEVDDPSRAVTTSPQGIGGDQTPRWTIVAATAVNAIDIDSPSASLGLEYNVPLRTNRIFLRKDLSENEVTGAWGDRAFGRALLVPSLANFSLSLRSEFRPWLLRLRCKVDCNSIDADTAKRDDEKSVVAQRSVGVYGSIEVGSATATATQPDGTTVSGHIVPIAMSAGLVYRHDGTTRLSSVLGNRVVVTGYVGPTVRLIGSEMTDRERIQVLSTKAASFWGGEAGLGIQVGDVLIDYRVTYLDNYRSHNDTPDPHVPGLTGFQAQLSLAFMLPTEVLGKTAAQ